MKQAVKFDDFQTWLDACEDIGFSLSEIKENKDEYYFETAGFKVAYWDREFKFGYLLPEEIFF